MATFSYNQAHHPFLLDSVLLPNPGTPLITLPLQPQQLEEMSSASTSFPHSFDAIQEPSTLEAMAYETSSSKAQASMEKKRSSGQSMDEKESSRRRKQRRAGCGQREMTEEKSTAKVDTVKEVKACDQEPPSGYIHVRARRGQATDSHSLAERVRREKISERMKMLQGLVPGCDKVVGKAMMLDEIINYVQSLQNQVEFLSMKLACANPLLYDFGLDVDGQMNQMEPELMRTSDQACSLVQTTAFENTAKSYSTLMDLSPPLSQVSGSFLMQVSDQRQGLLSQAMLNNMCSFQ